ncbi:hypothetical protein DFH09DRAFT_1359806 [Mycena vulgaris]|nr:hypothetical protein DFH09DRAFT_1359806 [Mycena vulgaris]
MNASQRCPPASPGIFPILEQFELPSLRSLILGRVIGSECATFMRLHGPKLTDLQLSHLAMEGSSPSLFELCPSISRLELRLVGARHPDARSRCSPLQKFITKGTFQDVYPPPLVFPSKHIFLARLVVRKERNFNKNGDIEDWERFLEESDWAHFPVLREIRAFPFEWPTDERGISKNPWVGWTEGLLTNNIKLMDEEGKHWTPRFKGNRR